MFEWKTASNAIYLGEDEGGKGRQFKARFLVPGLVKYDYGVCLLTKENADKFIQGFTGCPVIINHQNVTDKNVKDIAVGDIFSVWFDEKDGYYWCNGILRDKEAIKLINEGYSVSCQYLITEYSDNTTGALHNGNPYDKVIENGKPEHLAIVNNPRYEGAIIAVNALMADNEQWITIKPNGEENKGRHLLLRDGESPAEAVRRVYGDKNQKTLFDTKEYKKTKEDFKKEAEEKQKEYDKIEERKKEEKAKKDAEKQDTLKKDAEELTLEKFLQKHLNDFDGSYSKSMDFWEKHYKDYHTTSDENIINKHFKKEYEHYKGETEVTKELDALKKSMDNVDSLNYSLEDVKRINDYINEAESADYEDFAKAMRKKYERLPLETNEEYYKREREGKPFTDKKAEPKQSDKEEKKYTWNDKEYTLKELVKEGFTPTGYTATLDGSKPKQYLTKTSKDGKKEHRVPVSDDDLKKIKEYQKEIEAEKLQKAKEQSKDLTDYIKWQYSQDIKPHITRRVGDRTIVRWDDLSREGQSALKRLDNDDKIKLEQYSGSEMSIEVKDKKIFENLEKHRKASNAFVAEFKDTLYTVLAEGIYNRLGELIAQNEDKWITIHPHGEDSEDYRRLKIKDGESVEDAMHRMGWYEKRKARDEKNLKDENLSRSEKHPTPDNQNNNTNLSISKELEQKIKDNFISKNDFALKAFKNAHIDGSTHKILSNIDKLGKIEIKKVGLDKGKYSPSILGEQATIYADKDGTLYHEFAHSLDHRLGKLLDKGNPKFNWLSNELTDINTEIINKLNFKLPNDLEKKFKEYTDKVNNELNKKINNGDVANKAIDEARKKYKDFDTFPSWLKENILRENVSKEVTNLTKNIIKNMPDYTKWSTLSDMYSGFTMGRDNKDKFLGTHPEEYWLDQGRGLRSGKYANVNSEVFANYVEMRIGNYKEQLQYIKDNEPKLYKALDLLYNKIATEMEKL